MKKTKIIYAFLLVLLLSITNISWAQTDVVWVHGYEDTNTQWAGYSNLFVEERQMTSDNESYRTTDGIAAMGIAVSFWNPWRATYKFWRASQWKRGKDYLAGSEGSYKWLVGASRYETSSYQTYEKVACYDIISRVAPDDISEDCDEWRWVTHSYRRLIKEASDGFIARASQVGSKTNTWNPTQVEARGVNHMEMGTHPETERILRETWNGLHGGANSTQFIIPRI